MTGKIRRCDHTGDTTIAIFDSGNQQSVEVAQKELTRFLESCIATHGNCPPVWAKQGNDDFSEIDPKDIDSWRHAQEVIVHPMLIAG